MLPGGLGANGSPGRPPEYCQAMQILHYCSAALRIDIVNFARIFRVQDATFPAALDLMCGGLATTKSNMQRDKKMTTQNAPVTPASASPETKDWRYLDPRTAETTARHLRNEMIARFLRDVGKSVASAIAKRFRNRAVYQELSDLPDHLLNDIGVRRDQVSAIAYGGLKRQATDLEVAVGQRSISFFEHKPAAVAAAPQDNAPSSHKPLAA
jgi:uncharacterized protein YjiS (DUF1127 family)